jgi:hypothetical protein
MYIVESGDGWTDARISIIKFQRINCYFGILKFSRIYETLLFVGEAVCCFDIPTLIFSVCRHQMTSLILCRRSLMTSSPRIVPSVDVWICNRSVRQRRAAAQCQL